jgi:hypothetical protein
MCDKALYGPGRVTAFGGRVIVGEWQHVPAEFLDEAMAHPYLQVKGRKKKVPVVKEK